VVAEMRTERNPLMNAIEGVRGTTACLWKRGAVGFVLAFFATSAVSAGPKVVLVPLEGNVSGVTVERSIDGAENARQEGDLKNVIVELSLTGGELPELLRLCDYLYSLRDSGVRTCAFIKSTALPEYATLVALSCQTIAMEPDSRLGGLSLLGLEKSARTKLLERVKELARPPALYRRMMEGEEELSAYLSSATERWIFLTRSQFKALDDEKRGKLVQSEKICEANAPVVLSAQAARKFELVSYVVADRMELFFRLGLEDMTESDFVEVGGGSPLGRGSEIGIRIAEFFQLPFIRFLLILGGILGIFLEFQIPGFGVPGLVGLGCFAVLFGTGLATGYVSFFELGLFLVSLALIGLELLVIPGFGVAGVLGVTGLLVSLVLAMYKSPGGRFDWDQFEKGLLTMFLSITCAIVSIAVCARYLPKNPFIRRAGLVHEEAISGTSRGAVPDMGSAQEAGSAAWPVGEKGTAATDLRPAGKARVGGKLLDVVAESDFIDAGTPVVVVRREGPRTVVKPSEVEPSEEEV